jgi:prophage regulatory protein
MAAHKSAALPESGFIRLSAILGNRKSDPPIPGILPIGKSSWWLGVKSGKYPRSYKLGPKTTVWKIEDIRALISSAGIEGSEK